MTSSLSSIFMFRVFLLILHVLLRGMNCDAEKNRLCAASSCGEVHNISYPFRLKGDPKGCGNSKYELTCENNRTILYLLTGRYYVKSIHYRTDLGKDFFYGDITMVDDGLQKGNCSSLPRYSLAYSNFSKYGTYDPYFRVNDSSAALVTFMKCSQPVASASYVDTKPCVEGAYSVDTPPNFSQMKVYSYALHGFDLRARDIEDSCTVTLMAFAPDYNWEWEGDPYSRVSSPYKDLHNLMTDGFNLSYSESYQRGKTRLCFLGFRYLEAYCDYYSFHNFWTNNVALYAVLDLAFVLGNFLGAKFVLGAPCVFIFLLYKWRRRHLAMDKNIEDFLQAHNNFFPIRYSYSDIKKITRNFKHKLGEGGYGSVYKGILRSGNEVAVKILNNPKSNGQDFISEVATIGRIHHVNVVQLVGYCFNNSKQALVYDFMLNGSLDKHIFPKNGGDSLDYRKVYEISLGVARGIEYLHQGCDMQILHFDIKPHNILLDQNFTPKVSDFGLAKLYPVDHSIVSLTAARGTLGYIAPELFYKHIGGVSDKADVYSFGMLLMEIAARRRNVNANADRSSQIYFPLWVYDQISRENEVDMEELEEGKELTRKMVIVALWCIQLIPDERPSMSKVLSMLEGDIDKLRLPPKPLLYPSENPINDVGTKIEFESFSASSSAPTNYSGYHFQHNNEITKSYII